MPRSLSLPYMPDAQASQICLTYLALAALIDGAMHSACIISLHSHRVTNTNTFITRLRPLFTSLEQGKHEATANDQVLHVTQTARHAQTGYKFSGSLL